MHELAHEFTTRKVSPWGGLKYFYQTYMQSGMRDVLASLDLPMPGSNRGYDSVHLVEGFITSVVLGARRMAHSGWLRSDEVIQEIFGWNKGMASASTLCRFFQKFDIEKNNRIFPELQRKWFEQISIPKHTIDLDSTVITRYGNQEMACVGYNPQKQGRNSHHPLMAFAAEVKMVVNAWQRSGDSADALHADEFLDETFSILKRSKVGLVRMDAGFYSNKIMSYLEGDTPDQAVNYIVRARITNRLLNSILESKNWYNDDSVCKGASYSELFYQGSKWQKERRIIVVRTPKSGSSPGQSKIFDEDQMLQEYEFKAFVTSLTLPASKIHLLYNQRADCENRIKELKYDYGMDGFSMKSFAAMEAAFRFVMFAYNVMSLFKQKVMLAGGGKRLSTVRFQCIAIGSYLVKNGRNKKLKLAAEGERRHFLDHLFANLEKIDPPFLFS